MLYMLLLLLTAAVALGWMNDLMNATDYSVQQKNIALIAAAAAAAVVF